MAFGFTPGYSEDLYLEDFTAQQFLALGIEAAKRNDWRIGFISDTGFIAVTSTGRFKWKAKITFRIEADKATIQSESVGNEMWDMGRNRKMVDKFTDAFTDYRYSLKPGDLDQKYKELQSNLVPRDQDVIRRPPGTTAERISHHIVHYLQEIAK